MQAYSMDLRERALLDSDAGMKAADVAVKYRVSGSWVRLLKRRRRETGEVAPRVQRHGRRRMLEPHLHTLAALIAEQPDRTLAELKDALGTPASLATIWRAVAALDVTVKKNGPALRTRSTCRGRAGRVARRRADLGSDTPGFSRRNRHYDQSPAAVWSGPPRGPRPRPRAVRPVADQYVSRGTAGHRPDRARGLRWRHRELPRLYRTDPRAHPASRGHEPITSDMPYVLRGGDAYVGCVVPESLRSGWVLLRNPAREALPRAFRMVPEIDLCHYDSHKDYDARMWAYPRLWAALRSGGIFISDDFGDDQGFRDFSEQNRLEPTVVSSPDSDGFGRYVGVLQKP